MMWRGVRLVWVLALVCACGAAAAQTSADLIGCYSFKNPREAPFVVITGQGPAQSIQFLGKRPTSEKLTPAPPQDIADLERFVGEMVGASVRAIVGVNDDWSTYGMLDREVAYKNSAGDRTRFAAFDDEFGPTLMFRVPCSR
jgi:hypothetical protein